MDWLAGILRKKRRRGVEVLEVLYLSTRLGSKVPGLTTSALLRVAVFEIEELNHRHCFAVVAA